jgi:putative hydrolase of the HAD superfamily
MIAHSVASGIQGIVLDAVGTLIDPAPAVATVYAWAALRQGVELDPDEVKSRFYQHFGQDEIDEARGPLATDEAIEHRRWRRIVAQVLPEVPDPQRAFSELWVHFGLPTSWRVFPDVAPALATVEASGLAIGIASNFDARLREVLVGLPELARWSDRVVISSEVGYRKPHPAFYQAACARLELAPGRVLHVGDDIENDLHGPRRAGVHSILIDREGRGGDGPRLRSLGGLLGWLDDPAAASGSRDPGPSDWGS